jgi:hypothetical protein
MNRYKLLIKKYLLRMEKRFTYLKQPWTIITLVVFIFWLWWLRATMNNRLTRLEEFQQSINMIEIQSTLSSIQKDIEWIKMELQR